MNNLTVLLKNENKFTIVSSDGFQVVTVTQKLVKDILKGNSPKSFQYPQKDLFKWNVSYADIDSYLSTLINIGYKEVCCWYDKNSFMANDYKFYIQVLSELRSIPKANEEIVPTEIQFITLQGFSQMADMKSQTLNTKLIRAIAQKAKGKASRAEITFPLPVTKSNIGYLWDKRDVESYAKAYKNYRKMKEKKND